MVEVNNQYTNLADIAVKAFSAIDAIHQDRVSLMSAIKAAAVDTAGSKTITLQLNVGGTVTGKAIDISTGAGALILDDMLQELSTVEQAAAQLVAAENKAQKQVHSVTGNG